MSDDDNEVNEAEIEPEDGESEDDEEVEVDLDAIDVDEDEVDLESDDDPLLADDDDDDAFVADDDDTDSADDDDEEEEETETAARARKRKGEEEEEDDDELLAPDDVEADLDRILKDRMVTSDEEDDDEDDEEVPAKGKGGGEPVDGLQPKRADEQLCPNCFLNLGLEHLLDYLLNRRLKDMFLLSKDLFQVQRQGRHWGSSLPRSRGPSRGSRPGTAAEEALWRCPPRSHPASASGMTRRASAAG